MQVTKRREMSKQSPVMYGKRKKSPHASANLIPGTSYSLFLHARFSCKRIPSLYLNSRSVVNIPNCRRKAEMDARYQFGYSLQARLALNSHLFINDSMGFHYYTNERFQDQYRKKKPERWAIRLFTMQPSTCTMNGSILKETDYHGVDEQCY